MDIQYPWLGRTCPHCGGCLTEELTDHYSCDGCPWLFHKQGDKLVLIDAPEELLKEE